MLVPWRKSYGQPRQHIKKQRHYFANKSPFSQNYGFPIVVNRCENWIRKKAEHQGIDVFELWCWRRLLRVPWTAKGIKPVNPKGKQSWIFIGRTDAEAEAPILWPPDGRTDSLEKTLMLGKVRQEETGTTEDEMVGWHHRLNGCEFEQAPGVGDRSGSLMCFSPRGCKDSDLTERLNWTCV